MENIVVWIDGTIGLLSYCFVKMSQAFLGWYKERTRMTPKQSFEVNWRRWLKLVGPKQSGKLPDFTRLAKHLDVEKVLKDASHITRMLESLDTATLWGALCMVRTLAKSEKAGRFCTAVAKVATSSPDRQIQELAIDILVSAKKNHDIVAQVLERWVETLLEALSCSSYWAQLEAVEALVRARDIDWPEGYGQRILAALTGILDRGIPTEDENDCLFGAIIKLLSHMSAFRKETSLFSEPLYNAFFNGPSSRQKKIGKALAQIDPENVVGRLLPQDAPLGPIPLSTFLEFLPRGQRLESAIFALVRNTRDALSGQLPDDSALANVEGSLVEGFLQAVEAGNKITSYFAPESIDILILLIRHPNKGFAIRAVTLISKAGCRDEHNDRVHQAFVEYLEWDGHILEVLQIIIHSGWCRDFWKHSSEPPNSWFKEATKDNSD